MRPWKTHAGILLTILLTAPAGWAVAAEEPEEEPKLLGRITAQQLEHEPFSEWFREGYDGYEPNPEVLAELRSVDSEGVGITVFFGTWCPDSRRAVPRLLKLLDDLQFPEENLTLVAIDNEEKTAKTSPTGEEKGVEVYRVPTVVVSRDGREVARLVEHPILSLERDLLSILSGEPYEANYITYPIIRRWLREGLLADDNVSPRGLAGQLRRDIRSEGELAAAGTVLLARGDVREAVKLFRVNCFLYPESSRSFTLLAKGLRELGETAEAREMAEEALRLNEDPWRVKDLVELIDSTRE